MGYEAYEQPEIGAMIYYYNKEEFNSVEFCEKFWTVLDRYGYLNVTKIEIGKYKLVNGIFKDYTVRYRSKQIAELDIAAELESWVKARDITDISFVCEKNRHFLWGLTWHKDYDLPDGTSISKCIFNTVTMHSAYECFATKESQDRFLGLFYELSYIFDSFYGHIEDVSTSVDILESTKEKVFNPERIQAVYWGNYLGRKHCSDIGRERLEAIPCENKRCSDNGFFFWLSNNISDSRDNPDFKLRKRIYKHLTKKRF